MASDAFNAKYVGASINEGEPTGVPQCCLISIVPLMPVLH